MRSSIRSRAERARAAGALAAVVLVLAPGVGRATVPGSEDVEARARQHFSEGTLAYDLGEFQKALQAYTEAYRLVPKPALLFNVAQCHRQLGQYERAAFFYRRFLYLVGVEAPDVVLARELLEEVEEKARASRPPGSEAAVSAPRQVRASVKQAGPATLRREPPPDAPVAERRQARDTGPRAAGEDTSPLLQPRPAEAVARDEPLTRKWWLWAGVGAVALVAGGLVYAATAPEGRQTTLGTLPRR